MKLLKNLYDWLMNQAKSKNGKYALFIISFIEAIASVFPLTLIFLGLAIANPKKSYQFAFFSTAGAVFGAILGYGIGFYAWIDQDSEFTRLAQFFFANVPGFSVDAYREIQHLYREWNFLIIFTAGFAPMPFELITITSGVFHVNFIFFVLSVIAGRGARYYLLAFLIWKFGEPVKLFIDKYFNFLALGISGCIILFFVVIKLLI